MFREVGDRDDALNRRFFSGLGEGSSCDEEMGGFLSHCWDNEVFLLSSVLSHLSQQSPHLLPHGELSRPDMTLLVDLALTVSSNLMHLALGFSYLWSLLSFCVLGR